MSAEKSSYHIGNRTLDFPACSKLPQPITLPRAPNTRKDDGNSMNYQIGIGNFLMIKISLIFKP
jgi:hypothetical protein